MKFKKIMMIGLCSSMLLLTGCGKIATLKDGEEIAASTDEINITSSDLYNKMKSKYASSILLDMIDRAILDKKYETTDTLEATIKEQITSVRNAATEAGYSFETYIYYYYGVKTEDQLHDYIELSLKRNTAVTEYLSDKVTDDEIKAYYDDETVGDIKASHILISAETTDSMTDAEITAAEEKALNLAKSIIKKLNDGEDFATLAKEYSDDEGSASDGGNLGYFNKGVMETTFETAAFALEKGKYTTTPIETSYGYHIILKTDEKSKPTLAKAKTSIISNIVDNKLEADTTLSYSVLDKIRKEANLKINDSELKALYDANLAASLKTTTE
ncbi:MAG: peptidylprolyl isomerase [Bacilli bacterium]|nr:peptidylprolyl isomerase [Bacilli bacterium]